ncbi:TBPIP-domain-containing protein [Armillaria luteobubalina]|uniref:TBPIP-domain-containing protein n=1 Tax=Armillaria luteobubalina TaxID=153913 RepID=A0AA39QKI8_9AGAR|nr:TBPIP-domain-containing protein [Armillaria luteobubalina]
MSKPKSDIKVLKGQEAEDKVLEYVKRMNRPYGAVDVAANLKGAVPKAATQKILVSLAEKGALVQKTYGKTTFFVANQAKRDTVPAEKIASFEEEYKRADDENKLLLSDIKSANNELSKIKSTPSDAELDTQIVELMQVVAKKHAILQPLRSGSPLVSAEDLALVDAEWIKWRTEWVRRRKIFINFWQLTTDALAPQDATELSEELGIELDAPEHTTLERSTLCQNMNMKNSLKRKR